MSSVPSTIHATATTAYHQSSGRIRAAGSIGDVQVRNRGTIGGNVCVSDPTNHFPPLLVALDASFTIRGQDGERTVSADEFFVGTLTTALARGEILVAVEVPPLPEGSQVVHRHLQLAKDSWAVARCVVRLDVVEGSVIAARVTLGTYTPVQRPGDIGAILQGVTFASVEDVVLANVTTGELSTHVRLAPDGRACSQIVVPVAASIARIDRGGTNTYITPL